MDYIAVKITVNVGPVEIKNITHFCPEALLKNETNPLLFDGLECDTEYNISVEWISPNEHLTISCPLDFHKTQTSGCSGNLKIIMSKIQILTTFL